jgi:hypothetical protein
VPEDKNAIRSKRGSDFDLAFMGRFREPARGGQALHSVIAWRGEALIGGRGRRTARRAPAGV